MTVSRDYENDLHWDVDLADGTCLDHLPEGLESRIADVDALSELPDYDAADLDGPYTDLASHLGADPEAVVANDVGATLQERLPAFRYIGESSTNGLVKLINSASLSEIGVHSRSSALQRVA